VATEYLPYHFDTQRLIATVRLFMPPGVPPETLALAGRPWTTSAKRSRGKAPMNFCQRTRPSAPLPSLFRAIQLRRLDAACHHLSQQGITGSRKCPARLTATARGRHRSTGNIRSAR